MSILIVLGWWKFMCFNVLKLIIWWMLRGMKILFWLEDFVLEVFLFGIVYVLMRIILDLYLVFFGSVDMFFCFIFR